MCHINSASQQVGSAFLSDMILFLFLRREVIGEKRQYLPCIHFMMRWKFLPISTGHRPACVWPVRCAGDTEQRHNVS